MLWALLVLFIGVKALNSVLLAGHKGALIPQDDLWSECYRRYNDGSDLLSACSALDCEEIGVEFGAGYEKTCTRIQNTLNGLDAYEDHLAIYARSFRQIVQSWKGENPLEEGYVSIGGKSVRSVIPTIRNGLIGGDLGNLTNLLDWEPILDLIGQGETKYYQFTVNTTLTGLLSFYHILVFLSGNICVLPDSIGSDDQLQVDYGFDVQLVTNALNATYLSANFLEGYMKGLATHDIPANPNNTFVTLYVRFIAPKTKNATDVWHYQFGVLQRDLVFQWDTRTWVTFVDLDATSALLITGNFTHAPLMSLPATNSSAKTQYELYLYPEGADNDFEGLTYSWCAVRNGPALLSSGKDMEILYTNRSKKLRQQFYVTALNKSTSYVGFALQSARSGPLGGTVFKSEKFSTKSSEACELIYNLEFCENVAYAVPASPESSLLGLLYDNYTSHLYKNFEKALNQVPCETEPDAIFSPLTSCANCAEAYKNWLCSVTIPRCTTEEKPEYVYRPVNSSRNDFINDQVQPIDYFEILPCFNSCHVMVKDCPSVFGFSCPDNVSYITNTSYYWDMGFDYLTCNYVGAPAVKNWGARLGVSWVVMSFLVLFWWGYI